MEKKYDVIALGELLIDFTMNGQSDQGNNMFEACPGGAPCNVLALLNKMGKKTAFVGKVGEDQFGRLLKETITEAGIDASNLKMDSEVNTTLAFVHTFPDGDREFSFYRNPSADMLLSADEIPERLFRSGDILHFCSVDLIDAPVRGAHRRAIEYADKSGAMISFDPNLRPNLWETEEKMLAAVRGFLPCCHLLKVSEEELLSISGERTEHAALNAVFRGKVMAVLISRGSRGASIALRDGTLLSVPGERVDQIDSTGAGDVFIGTFLFQLLADRVTVGSLCGRAEALRRYLRYANHAAAISVTRRGAIASMPTYAEVFQCF